MKPVGEAFELALAECASEPIHLIGSVQPHGLALVFSDEICPRLLQHTQNAASILGGQPRLGAEIKEVLGPVFSAEVLKLKAHAKQQNTANGCFGKNLVGGNKDWLVHVYLSGSAWVLELEEDLQPGEAKAFAELLMETQQSMISSNAYADIDRYLDLLAGFVFKMTGFDSVMVYRFDEEWNGQIASQYRAAHAPSYLGMYFPASDIPEQARRLYTTNLVRIVVDVDAVPVLLEPEQNPQTGQLLDMTYSALRSLSPIHIEYLKNIGIQASMTISLLQNGRLWGLIACHHMSPKRVSMAMREAGIFISRLASVRLSSVEAQEKQRMTDRATEISGDLLKALPFDSIAHVVERLLPELKSLMSASGVLAVVNGKWFSHGKIPEATALKLLLSWLSEQAHGEIVVSNHLAKDSPVDERLLQEIAGLLSTPPQAGMQNVIVWFRVEKPKTVNWAGHYEEGFVQNGAGNFRLTPRKSFELWTEAWRGRSEPWSVVETDIATMLALALPEALAQKHQLDLALAQRDAAERALNRYLDELETQVKARTADLSLARDVAEAASRAKSLFLANMSHELRTPLNGILGMAELAQRRAADPKQIEYLGKLTEAAQHLSAIINDVLEISRNESAPQNVASVPFFLEDVLQHVHNSVSPLAEKKGLLLSLENESQHDANYVYGDPERIRQVLLNLVGNAIKFTEAGFVVVASSLHPVDENKVRLSFEVSDSGVGIAAEDLQRIFLPFEQIDMSMTRVHGGTGLGLALCKQIAEMMGGKISVESQPGVGSTFVFSVVVGRGRG